MLKKLVKYGNSHALVLDKALLELLDINPYTTKLKLSTDGKSFTIQPISQHVETPASLVEEGEPRMPIYIMDLLSKDNSNLKPDTDISAKEFQAFQEEKSDLRQEFITKYKVDMDTILEEKFSTNPTYCKEVEQLNQNARAQNLNVDQWGKALGNLIEKHAPFPEFNQIRKEYAQRLEEIGKKHFKK